MNGDRQGRDKYFLFGLIPLTNLFATIIYVIKTQIHGSEILSDPVPPILAACLGLLFSALVSSAKRGHDLGWNAWSTLGGFLALLGFGPAVFALALFLTLKKGQADNEYGGIPSNVSRKDFLAALSMNSIPWALIAASRF